MLYDANFCAVTPRVAWARVPARVSEKLGKTHSHTLLNRRAHAGWHGSGRFLELIYDVSYEKYPAREVILVRRGLLGGPPAIIAHHINSRGLLLE